MFKFRLGDKELVNFLTEEISTETKSSKSLAKAIDGFKISTMESEVTLVKEFNDERWVAFA
jgi:hypothetical protein